MANYRRNFARTDRKGVILELSDYPFSIGKIQINFVSYDTNTFKTKFQIPIYMDFTEFLSFREAIRNGSVLRKLQNSTNSYEKGFTLMAGDGALKAQNKSYPFKVPQGKAVSRQFAVQKSTSNDYCLIASYSLAREDSKGLIVPEGKPLNYIMVPIAHNDLMGFLEMGKIRIEAFENMKMLNFKDSFTFDNFTF